MRIGFSSSGDKDTNYFSHYVIKVLKMLYLEVKITGPTPLARDPSPTMGGE
jgi:hypothetical protein